MDSRRSLSEALVQDLKDIGAYERIGAVIISGDLITRGKWDDKHEVQGKDFTGGALVQNALDDLSQNLRVAPNRFFVVPGNHDIVRDGLTSAQITEYLINYKHEMGFRRVRDEFSKIYKLSPLNYGVQLLFGKRTVAVGLLNSAYLNEKANFKDYGFVGDDAEHVFRFLGDKARSDALKILVVHHHLTPIYERDIMGADGIVSMTLDAAYILRRAQEVGVNVVLHGHQHAAKMVRVSSWSPEMDIALKRNPRTLEILAGGSAGAKAERLPPNESNMYALISVKDDPPKICSRRIYNSARRGEAWG